MIKPIPEPRNRFLEAVEDRIHQERKSAFVPTRYAQPVRPQKPKEKKPNRRLTPQELAAYRVRVRGYEYLLEDKDNG